MLSGISLTELIYQEMNLTRGLPRFFSFDEWIIDGNYSRTIEMRLAAYDTVFLFDLPTEICIQGATERLGKSRYDMPWIANELDPDFKRQIEEFAENKLPEIYVLLEKYKCNKKIIIFKSREQINEFINKYPFSI